MIGIVPAYYKNMCLQEKLVFVICHFVICHSEASSYKLCILGYAQARTSLVRSQGDDRQWAHWEQRSGISRNGGHRKVLQIRRLPCCVCCPRYTLLTCHLCRGAVVYKCVYYIVPGVAASVSISFGNGRTPGGLLKGNSLIRCLSVLGLGMLRGGPSSGARVSHDP